MNSDGIVYASSQSQDGHFYFKKIPEGTYTIEVTIPKESFDAPRVGRWIIDQIDDLGYDMENNRVLFKLNYNFFVLEANCKNIVDKDIEPTFSQTNNNNDDFVVKIIKLKIEKRGKIKGLFYKLNYNLYKRCINTDTYKTLINHDIKPYTVDK